MKIAVMQPYLFPYMGYFQLIEKVDRFILFDNVRFMKKSFINRNFFKVSDRCTRISFPITNISQNRDINDHFYTKEACDVLHNLKLKERNNRRVVDQVAEMIENEFNVAIINGFAIREISNTLGIKVEFSYASDHVKKWDNAKFPSGQEKVIHLCQLVGASTYLNPAKGIRLYEHGEFEKNNICLKSFSPYLTEDEMSDAQSLSIASLLEEADNTALLAQKAKHGSILEVPHEGS